MTVLKTRLADVLADVLAAAVDALDDPPARRYIAAAEPAADCEQLTVHAAGARTTALDQPLDTPSPRPQPRVRVATIVVTLFRPVCTAANPTAEQLDEDGRGLAVDGWALYAGLVAWLHGGGLKGHGIADAANVTLAEARGNQGGVGGWTVSIDIAL